MIGPAEKQEIRDYIVEEWRKRIIEAEAARCLNPIALGIRVAQVMEELQDDIEESVEREILAAETRRRVLGENLDVVNTRLIRL